jgi:hypothetical protein
MPCASYAQVFEKMVDDSLAHLALESILQPWVWKCVRWAPNRYLGSATWNFGLQIINMLPDISRSGWLVKVSESRRRALILHANKTQSVGVSRTTAHYRVISDTKNVTFTSVPGTLNLRSRPSTSQSKLIKFTTRAESRNTIQFGWWLTSSAQTDEPPSLTPMITKGGNTFIIMYIMIRAVW